MTDTEIIISDNCMNRNKMNENESLVDNENEEEDEVLEAPILLERVEDEDKEKDDDFVSKKKLQSDRNRVISRRRKN